MKQLIAVVALVAVGLVGSLVVSPASVQAQEKPIDRWADIATGQLPEAFAVFQAATTKGIVVGPSGLLTILDDVGGQVTVQEGKAIRRAERQIVDTHVRNAREIEMDGHRVKAVNATVLFSEIAGELAKGRAFGACYFDRQDGRRQWSLRSDAEGVDVSAIAKAHGGGGHRQAAGFESAI